MDFINSFITKNKLKENKNRKVDDDLGVCVLKLLPEVS